MPITMYYDVLVSSLAEAGYSNHRLTYSNYTNRSFQNICSMEVDLLSIKFYSVAVGDSKEQALDKASEKILMRIIRSR